MWRRYSLSLTLLALFVAAWAGQAVVQWYEFANDQAEHGLTPDMHGYLLTFLRSTLENWQSEWLQLLTFVVLTAFLVHEGSHESKSESDRQERKIDAILARLDKMEGR